MHLIPFIPFVFIKLFACFFRTWQEERDGKIKVSEDRRKRMGLRMRKDQLDIETKYVQLIPHTPHSLNYHK